MAGVMLQHGGRLAERVLVLASLTPYACITSCSEGIAGSLPVQTARISSTSFRGGGLLDRSQLSLRTCGITVRRKPWDRPGAPNVFGCGPGFRHSGFKAFFWSGRPLGGCPRPGFPRVSLEGRTFPALYTANRWPYLGSVRCGARTRGKAPGGEHDHLYQRTVPAVELGAFRACSMWRAIALSSRHFKTAVGSFKIAPSPP